MTSAAVKPPPIELSDVAETALVTLFCRALESASADPVLRDPAAEELVARLRPRLAASDRPLQQALARGEVEDAMRIYVALRSRYFDRCARGFLARHPDGTVVSLGGGLDTRWRRIGAPPRFLTVDLPEMIALRDSLLAEDGIASDVRAAGWLPVVAARCDGPVMFLAEGLVMYLATDEVRDLFAGLRSTFPRSELVVEVFNRGWLAANRRAAIDARLSETLRFGDGARFVSGFTDNTDPVAWFPDLRVLGEWSFLDEPEPKLGRLRKLRHFPGFRKRQWVVRYRF